MFCKIFTVAKTFLDMVTCKMKHLQKSFRAAGRRRLQNIFCKCFILQVTTGTVYLQTVFDRAKNILQHFCKCFKKTLNFNKKNHRWLHVK